MCLQPIIKKKKEEKRCNHSSERKPKEKLIGILFMEGRGMCCFLHCTLKVPLSALTIGAADTHTQSAQLPLCLEHDYLSDLTAHDNITQASIGLHQQTILIFFSSNCLLLPSATF